MTEHVDVAVIGSGAAGLVAACRAADGGARVVVLEKADLLGGTSAVSGGVMWMPDNHLMEGRHPDSEEAALAYLTAATGGHVPDARLRWYLATSREAVRYLDERTLVRLTPLPRPDYHTDWAGAAVGRGLDNLPFEGAEHPGLSARVRPPTYFPTITMTERDAAAATGVDLDLVARRDAAGTRTMGGALVCALVASAEERGIAIRAGFAVRDLRRHEDGWVVDGGAAGRVFAGSVVIASGGFEWSERLQEAFLPNPVTPISAPSNTGDGLELGLAAGGSVTTMRAVWGVPVVQDPDHVYDGRPSGRMANVELTLPGSIMVNSQGRRFVNEAVNYHDLNKVFRSIDSNTGELANVPAWMVVDSRYLARYPVAGRAGRRAPAVGGDRRDARGARPAVRRRPRGARRDRRGVQPARRAGVRPALLPRRRRRRPLPRRRHERAEPVPGAARAGAVHGGADPARDARHLRRAGHRRRRRGAGPVRRADPGPLRRGQRLGRGLRRRLPGRRGDAGLGHHPRLRRRPRDRGPPRQAGMRKDMGLFAVIYRYSTRHRALDEHRPSHKDYLRTLFEAGVIVVSGPLGEGGGPGALLVLRAESADAVRGPPRRGPVPPARADRRAGGPGVEPGLRWRPPRRGMIPVVSPNVRFPPHGSDTSRAASPRTVAAVSTPRATSSSEMTSTATTRGRDAVLVQGAEQPDGVAVALARRQPVAERLRAQRLHRVLADVAELHRDDPVRRARRPGRRRPMPARAQCHTSTIRPLFARPAASRIRQAVARSGTPL